mmetsp:Transcript_54435/g.130034  ORF Transcript_54435/g.130034 Transcript_54435/m.130034 type:complete len:359 (-) Transcript_54435:418-1494(-)
MHKEELLQVHLPRFRQFGNAPDSREGRKVHVHGYHLREGRDNDREVADHLIELVHLTVRPTPVLRHPAGARIEGHPHRVRRRRCVADARMLVDTKATHPVAPLQPICLCVEDRCPIMRQLCSCGLVRLLPYGFREDGGDQVAELVAPVVRHHKVRRPVFSISDDRGIGARIQGSSLHFGEWDDGMPDNVVRGGQVCIEMGYAIGHLLPEEQELRHGDAARGELLHLQGRMCSLLRQLEVKLGVAIAHQLGPADLHVSCGGSKEKRHADRLNYGDSHHDDREGEQPLPLVKLGEVCDEECNEKATEEGVEGAADPKDKVLHLPEHDLLVPRIMAACTFVHEASLPHVSQQRDREADERD